MFRSLAVSLSPAKATGVAAISTRTVKKVKVTTAAVKSPSKKKSTTPPKKSKTPVTTPKKHNNKKVTTPKKSKSPARKKASASSTFLAAVVASPVPSMLPAAPANTPAVKSELTSLSMVLASPMAECRTLFTEFIATGEEVATPASILTLATSEVAPVQQTATIAVEEQFLAATHMDTVSEIYAAATEDLTPAVERTIDAAAAADNSTANLAENNIVSAMKTLNDNEVTKKRGGVHFEIEAESTVKIPTTSRFGAIAPQPEEELLCDAVEAFAHLAQEETPLLLAAPTTAESVAEPEIAVAEPTADVMAAFEHGGFEAPQISYPEVDESTSTVTLSANPHTDNLEAVCATTTEVDVASVATATPVESTEAPSVIPAATAAPQESAFEFKCLF